MINLRYVSSLLAIGLIYAFWPSRGDDVAIKDLTWGELNFLHTTDTHGWYAGHLNQKVYSGNWGDFVSFTDRMKHIAESEGRDLLLIDSGDRHDGNGLSDITTPNGIKSTEVFMKADYDILTIGNHELYVWENSKQEYDTVTQHFSDKYVCSNVEYKLENGTFVHFGKRSLYFETKVQKKKVLAFGFLFDFKRANAGTRVTPIKKIVDHSKWFNETIHSHPESEVDIIIVVGHTPIDHAWDEFYYLNSHLRKFYPNTIIQYFGGHSHIRDFSIFDERASGIQSGRYCETVGFLGVNFSSSQNPRDIFSRSYIDFNRKSFMHHTNTNPESFDTEKGQHVTDLTKNIRSELELDKPIGHVSNNYYVDFVPINHERSIFGLLTNRVLHTLPFRDDEHKERLILINTGSIRYDLYKGPYTIDSMYIVSPFQNVWSTVRVPKSIAVKVATKLNEKGYILTDSLLPPHHQTSRIKKRSQSVMMYPVIAPPEINHKLSKGYVTHDDFGSDGDDTPHKAVVHFEVPSVVQSVQFTNTDDVDVDLVFYEFITSNVLEAVKELNLNISAKDVSLYSEKYLGLLLNDYVKNDNL